MKKEIVSQAKRRGNTCPICRERGASEIHHIMHGADRKKSEEYPLACLTFICDECHRQIHHTEKADNKFETLDYRLKVQAERDFKKYYPEDDWFKVFGKYYDIFGD